MKCTVVSTLPLVLYEPKYGLIPDLYQVPKANKGDVSLLTVADGYHYELVPLASDRMPPRKIPDLGEVIAQSIVQDYISSKLGVDYTPLDNGAVPIPGLFWVEGSFTYKNDDVDKDKEKEIKKNQELKNTLKLKFQEKINQAVLNTTAWFERIIKIADDDWAKYHQYRFITDDQRKGCNWLGLQREWNFTVFDANNSLCWACKKVVNPSAIICQCGAILDMVQYEARKAQFIPK